MRPLAAALGLPLSVLLAGAATAGAAAEQGPSPRPVVSAFRFTPQPLKPGRTGSFRFLTTREGGAIITLARQLAGRRAHAGGRCLAPARAPKATRVCLRAIPVGRLRFAVDAGEGRKRFDGRLDRRRLAPGRYRATLRILNDAFGDSDPARLTLRIAAR